MPPDFSTSDLASVARADGSGVRDIDVPDRWNTWMGTPNGGYILAMMLTGLRAELAAAEPVVASISYLKPPSIGPAELHTSVLRIGKRLQTGEVTLRQGGKNVAHLVASFGDRPPGRGRSVELGVPPQLPDPDVCLDPRAELTGREGIFGRVEYRLPRRPGWVDGAPSGDPTIELWLRLDGGRPVDLEALAFLCDAYVPVVSELGEASSMTVQLTVHLHRTPAPGWIAARITTRHLVGGFHEEDCELWDAEGRLVAQSRQLGILT